MIKKTVMSGLKLFKYLNFNKNINLLPFLGFKYNKDKTSLLSESKFDLRFASERSFRISEECDLNLMSVKIFKNHLKSIIYNGVQSFS